MTEHDITGRTWTDPHLGRRAKFICSCDWTAGGDCKDATAEKKQHEFYITEIRSAAEYTRGTR